MLTFLTPHQFDIRALTIMGVNAKPNTDSPIGYFGTGLKYAVAVLSRLDCRVEFEFDENTWFVHKQNTSFRGKEFQELWLRSRGDEPAIRLPFTTELGKNWTALMAYRELVSNTRDEGGTILAYESCYMEWQGSNIEAGKQFGLTIRVYGESIDEARANHSAMFLESRPIETFSSLEIHSGPSQQVYYRGVAVLKLDSPSLFTYNLLDKQVLTEDRTLASSWSAGYAIVSKIAQSKNPRVYQEIARYTDGSYEKGNLSFSGHVLSTEFATYVADQFELGGHVRLDLVRIAQTQLGRLPKRKSIQLYGSRKAMLDQALAILAHFRIHPDQFTIEVAEHLEGRLGTADSDTKTIILSDQAFGEGMTKLVGTILEEYIHLNYNVYDCTREFQDKAMDIAARAMIDGFSELDVEFIESIKEPTTKLWKDIPLSAPKILSDDIPF